MRQTRLERARRITKCDGIGNYDGTAHTYLLSCI